jgi:hypothetical protein
MFQRFQLVILIEDLIDARRSFWLEEAPLMKLWLRLVSLVSALLVAGVGVGAPLPVPVEAATTSPLANLPLTIQIQSTANITYFDQIAHPTDVGQVGATNLSFLAGLNRGEGMATYTSWASGHSQVSTVAADKAKLFGYNPEHWSQTPTAEQNNLVATVKNASTQVHAAGLQFFLAPDDQFDSQYAAQLAPYADIYCVQAEHYETSPTTFSQWVLPTTATIRAANPNVKVYIEVSTQQGTPAQIDAALLAVQGKVDGIVIWSGATQTTQLKQTVSLIR